MVSRRELSTGKMTIFCDEDPRALAPRVSPTPVTYTKLDSFVVSYQQQRSNGSTRVCDETE